MICFDPVVRVLLGHMRSGRDQVAENPQVCAALSVGHLHGRVLVAESAFEEPAGRRGVPLFGQQHVDDLPELVDRPIQVPPPASDLHIGLIHEPPIPDRVPTRPGGLGEQRREPRHPPVDRDVVDVHAALGQQLLDIPVGEAVAEIPAHRERDHLRWNWNPANADRSTFGRAARRRGIRPACSSQARRWARRTQQTHLAWAGIVDR